MAEVLIPKVKHHAGACASTKLALAGEAVAGPGQQLRAVAAAAGAGLCIPSCLRGEEPHAIHRWF